jgi:hypothetical protein
MRGTSSLVTRKLKLQVPQSNQVLVDRRPDLPDVRVLAASASTCRTHSAGAVGLICGLPKLQGRPISMHSGVFSPRDVQEIVAATLFRWRIEIEFCQRIAELFVRGGLRLKSYLSCRVQLLLFCTRDCPTCKAVMCWGCSFPDVHTYWHTFLR